MPVNWFTLLIAIVLVIFIFRLLSIIRSVLFRLIGVVAGAVAVWRLYILFTYR